MSRARASPASTPADVEPGEPRRYDTGMPNHVEVPEWLNAKTIEIAYGRVLHAQEKRDDRYASAGLRAARARDPKLLLALDKGAEVLDKTAENQQGRTRRSSEVEGLKVVFTEATMWRNAYEMCDQGNQEGMHPYAHIYGAAALLAGLVY